jgi:hypothetical protein
MAAARGLKLFITKPLSFLAVPADGKDLDNDAKCVVSKHFWFFHLILLPLFKRGS